ncbi:MAG: acyl-CoA dehydrogenase family protein [Propionivibrio sp.]|uniref:acyl-CoA dehydrogenase family protein n=1 Tax=Propionivibrio sp. TaxID=2212460 RepID=UPI0025DF30EA|nr:acyl-CoA dehydrogenase family protein [Propionivibrio sp.]MBK8894781.1 acyl-CoA dehydrogenase family protein [Propionivibrio sp.]MBL0209007.1 acyl-CoA dehydrogenase family protein [Propionivibrio sp.]
MYIDHDNRITPAQAELKAKVHAFARDVLRPAAAALDPLDAATVAAPDSALWTTLRASYAAGLHTALIPTTHGGMGLDGMELALALEELGWGSADFAVSLAVTGFPASLAAKLGQAELHNNFVAPFVADGKAAWIGCWAITEPNHGSDHFLMNDPQFRDPTRHGEVTARAQGDHWILNGAKARWVSNGGIATHAAVYLNTDPARGLAGGGIALVPLDLPGVIRGPHLDKLGQRALNQGGFAFDNVSIPSHFMLAGAELYPQLLDQTLALTNAAMGSIFTGVAQAAFEAALAHTQTRMQGGKRLCEHQLVQKRLFDMYCRVESSRALSRNAFIWNAGRANPATELATAAKIYCTEAAYAVCDSAVQLLGGAGLAKGELVEKLYRDARAALLEDGSNDVLALSGAQLVLSRQADD